MGRELHGVEEIGWALGRGEVFGDEVIESGQVGAAVDAGVDVVAVEVF